MRKISPFVFKIGSYIVAISFCGAFWAAIFGLYQSCLFNVSIIVITAGIAFISLLLALEDGNK